MITTSYVVFIFFSFLVCGLRVVVDDFFFRSIVGRRRSQYSRRPTDSSRRKVFR
jgi:hypothetical protein